jgi:gas vesicle protein
MYINLSGGEPMERQKSTLGSFMKGLLIGGLTATMVSLFTAPQSGPETRRRLREKGEQVREMTAHTLENTREQVNSILSNTRQRADQTVQRIENIEEKISKPLHR